MARKREVVEAGSGNVFEDLGFADAGERRLKVQLAMRVNELIKGLGLTQAKAAKLFGIPQPHVSELANYKLSRFSSERSAGELSAGAGAGQAMARARGAAGC